MVGFIARMIGMARAELLEKGQDKYKAYFVRTSLYLQFKTEVDAILIQDGIGDCIVSV